MNARFAQFPKHRGPIHTLVFPDDERLFAGDNGGMMIGRTVPDGQVIFRRGFRHGIKGIEFNADESKALLVGTIDVRVLATEVVGEQALTILYGHQSLISAVHFLKDESYVVSSSSDHTIRLWKLLR